MKFFLSFIVMGILSFISCMYLPWWSIAVIVFLIALLIPQNPWKTFLCAFVSLFVLWSGLSFWISNNNENILAHKISLLLFNFDSPLFLIFITGLTGGIVAGFAGLAGSFLRSKPGLKI